MRKGRFVVVLLLGLLSLGLMAGTAMAADQVIEILDIGDVGMVAERTTADGTIFMADPNPTSPSTGTGVFEPFLRIGAGNGALVLEGEAGYAEGSQLGYNTDQGEPKINFDTKNGSNWTRAVQFSELGVFGGYYILSLDANESGGATTEENQIVITDLQIYIDESLRKPETGLFSVDGYTGTIFDSSDNELANIAPAWTLDNDINLDVDVVLQASICDSNGQCGSGHGDLGVWIPMELLGEHNPTDYFVLYTEYTGASDGFEEWRFNSTPTVPEPGTLLLLGSGLVGLALFGRKVLI